MSSSDNLPPGTMCIVCGDVATGNHYSIPSCNGCKTFFRRAIVNNRSFTCTSNGKCIIDKGVRCACRSCRLKKCILMGMDPNAIQSERDQIGYTKRKRKGKKEQPMNSESYPSSCSPIEQPENPEDSNEMEFSEEEDITFCGSKDLSTGNLNAPTGQSRSNKFHEGILEKLTQLENNFTLLLSRGEIHPYASLEEALRAQSRFSQPVNVKLSDPIVTPNKDQQKMPFWRSRIIALYIDWAKTFTTFRKLPYTDKVALITNHASSYMIMCEAFRTPELITDDKIINGIEKIAEKLPMEQMNSKFISESIHIPSLASPTDQHINSRETNFKMELEQQTNLETPVEKEIENEQKDSEEQSKLATSSISDMSNNTPSAMTLHPTLPSNDSIHTFFDPQLIRDGHNCHLSGVRSLADIPPNVHYPTVGNLSGLTPVMAAMIDCVMKPFRRLNISTTEFAALQAIMFFDPDTEGLDAASQRNVCAEQKKMISAFYSHICQFHELTEAENRFSSILLRIPMIRKVAAKKNESLQIIDLFNLFTLNSLVKETTLGIKGGVGSN